MIFVQIVYTNNKLNKCYQLFSNIEINKKNANNMISEKN